MSAADFGPGGAIVPLDITTFTLVDKPVTLQEGLKILERDGYCCRYCGLDGKANFENALVMTVDFVVPRARKGKKDPANLVACCWACNKIKAKRVYKSFEDAKAHVLARREALRRAWRERSAAAAPSATR
jgi:5-methylcytosine-specific restriction endonuclease McrA